MSASKCSSCHRCKALEHCVKYRPAFAKPAPSGPCGYDVCNCNYTKKGYDEDCKCGHKKKCKCKEECRCERPGSCKCKDECRCERPGSCKCKSKCKCKGECRCERPDPCQCEDCRCEPDCPEPDPDDCGGGGGGSGNPNTQLWQTTDYRYTTGISPSANFGTKSTSYNSPMAIDGTAYRTEPWKDDYQPRYYFHEASTTYPPGVFVPSGFDWNRGTNYWYNDSTYEIGQGNYSAIIGGLLSTSILTGQTVMRVKMANQNADVSDLTSQMSSALYGSTNILKWFTQLVDSYSNPIPYSTSSQSGRLKQIMAMLISSPNPINVNNLAQQLRNFLYVYFPNGQSELFAYIDQMIVYARKCLYGEELEFNSWFTSMSNQLEHIRTGYGIYRAYYESNRRGDAVRNLNRFCRRFIAVGEHIAAFFGLFFILVVILDRALSLLGSPTPSAIPAEKTVDILNYVLSNQLATWRQYIWTFLDYTMVSANRQFPNQMKQMFEIQSTLLQVSSPLSLFIGKILFSLDRLVRGRNLYSSFS